MNSWTQNNVANSDWPLTTVVWRVGPPMTWIMLVNWQSPVAMVTTFGEFDQKLAIELSVCIRDDSDKTEEYKIISALNVLFHLLYPVVIMKHRLFQQTYFHWFDWLTLLLGVCAENGSNCIEIERRQNVVNHGNNHVTEDLGLHVISMTWPDYNGVWWWWCTWQESPAIADKPACDDASRSTDRDTSSSLGQLQHVNNIGASCGCEQRVDLIGFS